MPSRSVRAFAYLHARKAMLLSWGVVGSLLLGRMAGPVDAALVLQTAGVQVMQDFNTLSNPLSVADANADGWHLSQVAGVDTFAGGTAALAFAQSATLDSATNSFGNFNFGVGSDRAIGFLFNSSNTGPRSIMLKVTNGTGQALSELALGWDLEEYRTGTRVLPVTFFHGADGANWTAETSGDYSFAADGLPGNVLPPNPPRKSLTISGLSLAAGASYYLRWSFGQQGATSNTPGVGLDNFSISGSVAAVPEASAANLALAASGLTALCYLARRKLGGS